jgi:hypothetical protein
MRRTAATTMLKPPLPLAPMLAMPMLAMPMLIALAWLLVPAFGGGAASAAERGPVCRETSVVDEMTREVAAQNYYATVDPRLVTEQSTADPLVVRCQVCVQSASYNTTRFVNRPIEQCLAHGFEVHILTNGFIVQDLR